MRAAAPAGSDPSPSRGRRGRPRGAIAVSGIALLCAAVVSAVLVTPAQAAAPRPLKVGVVTASDSFLVFAQKRGGSLTFTKGSTLYFIGRTGGRHALPDFDPERFPDLKGSMLTQSAKPNSRYDESYDPQAPEHVRWRDLRTGRHGVAELPAGDDYLAAAPGGWLATRTPAPGTAGGATHVVRYTTAGAVTDLGAPFPAGVPTTGLRSGTAGVLAVSAGDPERPSEDGTVGAVRYMPYSAPGRWRTIYRPGPNAKMYCGRPSKTGVVCEVSGTGSTHSGQVLIPLDGGTRRWLDAHPRTCQTVPLTAVGSSAFGKASSSDGPCVTGRIVQLTARGALRSSTRTYGGRGNVAAGLGGFLFASQDQRRILRLTSAGGTPKVVTTAH